MRFKSAIVFLVILVPGVCLAQALSDRVPADALVYVGWRGSNDLGPGFDQSHLKAVLANSQVGQLLNESLPKFLTLVSAQDPDASQAVAAIINIGGPLWRHPTAFYFGGLDKINPNMPLPKIAVLCDAADDSDLLIKRVNDVVALADPELQKFIKVKAFGHLVVVSSYEFALPGEPLSKSKNFLDAMGQMPKDPVAAVYVDGTATLDLVSGLVDQFGPPEVKDNWPKMRDGLGLAGLKKFVWADGFEGKNWVQSVFIDAPAPRTGLLSLMDSKPVSDDTLKLIPSTATMAVAADFDIAGLYTAIHDGMTKFNPDGAAQFDQSLDGINQMLGFDINKDFLAAFGPEWASYIDPVTAGNGAMGFVAANRARNAASLATSMSKIEMALNALIKSVPMGDGPKLALGFKKSTVNGVELHYFNSPLVTPTWAIKEGVLYVGLFPQVIASATAAGNGKTILNNPAYVETRKHLGGPQGVNSVAFSDLPKMAPDSYTTLLMLSRIYLGAGDLFGLDSPPLVVPTLDKILPDLEPAGQITWTDEAGFHARGLSPFPGSQVFGVGGVGSFVAAQSGMMAAFAIPSTFQARAQATRVESASNLRQIGQGCLLFSNDNKGDYPADLAALIKTEDMTADVMLNPKLGHKLPPDWGGKTPDEQAKWINENADYVYLGAGLKQGAEAKIVVAHEKMDPQIKDGINLLYADGHIEFKSIEDATHDIAESKKLRDNPQ